MRTVLFVILGLLWFGVGVSYYMQAEHKRNPRMRFGWVRFRMYCMLVHTVFVVLFVFISV